MDIVQTILNMLSGNVLSKLSSQIGQNEADTKAAVGTAVPTLLAGLGHLASSPGGAQRLASTMDQFGSGGSDPFASFLGGQTNAIADQGSSLLTSLFGSSGSSGIGGLLSRFTGLGGGSSSKLLSFLAPMIMGSIAKHFGGQAPSASGLSEFFASQKSNIASALPSGFSLSSIPGLSGLGSTAQSAADSTTRAVQAVGRETAGAAARSSKWLVPAIACLIILALIAFFVNRSKETVPNPTARLPEIRVPDVSQVRTNLSNSINSVSNSLASIKDSASADAALPTLRDVDSKLDSVKSWSDKLPQSARSTISQFASSNLSSLVDRMNSTLSSPGVPEKIQPTLQSIVSKLSDIAGVSPSQYTLSPSGTSPTRTATENP